MMYEIRYLPMARQDILNIVTYIKEVLKAPQAAADFVSAVDDAVSRLEHFPYSCQVYMPPEALDKEYRMLRVNNYVIMYTVSGDEVEIYRVIYARMDISRIIK